MNLLNRPYDITIPAPELAKLLERRRSPDGLRHQITETRRGGQRAYVYPWEKMELGDFFIVPIGSRSKHSMRISFHQAAARHDFEIAVTDWTMEDGSPGFRVAVTMIGVTRAKQALDRLLDEDEKLPPSKQKYRHVPRPRYSDLTNRRKSKRKSEAAYRRRIVPKSRQTPRPDPKDNPFWADNDPEVPQPLSVMEPAPEVKLSREEVIRRAQEAAQ